MSAEENGGVNVLRVKVKIPALEKLLDITASGMGGVAGPLLAPWKARREGQAGIIAAEADAKIRAIQAKGYTDARELLAAGKSIENGEIELGDLVKERIAYQGQKRLANIHGVVGRAAMELEGKEAPAGEPDHDWAARFFNDVQDVSSEEMQVLWAKVLAGEVERPGSTSGRTLGILRDMDRRTARLFATLCSACTFWGHMPGGGVLDARVVSLGSSAAMNSLEEFGLSFDNLNRLNEHGLIISDYNSWRDYGMSVVPKLDDGRPTVAFRRQDQWWVLVAVGAWAASKELRIHGVALTVSGRELSIVVGQNPMPEYTAKLKAFYVGQKLRMVTVEEHTAGN